MTAHKLGALVADVRATLGNAGELIGPQQGSTPRFELFNGANSICSQKVRTVLAHHGIPYRSHTMNMFTGQTYLPTYVRLRMIGCDTLGGPLMTVHTGSTSVSAGGCDPAVVPTLVDWEAGRVVVDSKRICFYLDGTVDSSGQLRPQRSAERIDAELAVVDNLPNYQMLSGKPPGADRRPAGQRGKTGIEFSMSKVERCDRYLAECADDQTLVRAYTAKRSKELTAAQKLFSEEAMRAAYDKAEAGCEGLERALATCGTHWLLGDAITMADLYWAVELLRMQNMGANAFWAHGARPAVAAFANRATSLDGVRAAVVDWPGAMF